MKRVFLILLCFIIYAVQANSQEIKIRGKVTDSEDGKALPFANIMLLDHNLGTNADIAGNFTICLKENHLMDTLVVSYMGYQTKRVSVRDFGTEGVQLKADVFHLDEFQFMPSKRKSTVLNPFRRRDCVVPYSNQVSAEESLWFPNRPGEPTIEALYFPLPQEDKNVFIREVWFYARNTGKKASFRVRIFNADEQQMPSEDLLTENVIAAVAGADEMIKVNLEKYNICIPENGVYVGFELLITPENKRIIPFPDESGSAEIYYPFLQYFPVGQDVDFSSRTYSGGVWKENKTPGSFLKKEEVYKPAISLVVEQSGNK